MQSDSTVSVDSDVESLWPLGAELRERSGVVGRRSNKENSRTARRAALRFVTGVHASEPSPTPKFKASHVRIYFLQLLMTDIEFDVHMQRVGGGGLQPLCFACNVFRRKVAGSSRRSLIAGDYAR